MADAETMTENEVVNAVCAYLESLGYVVEQRLTTTQTGDDILATRANSKLSIEAKGATSARLGSARYGRGFNSAQVRVHVSEAIYKALRVLSRPQGLQQAGIALPATRLHLREIATVRPLLARLGIKLFWVHSRDEVKEEPHTDD